MLFTLIFLLINFSDAKLSPYKPQYHFCPARNWMNDPCAPTITKDGHLHLFYQYSFQSIWDVPIVWGHATSADFVHFKPQHLALVPSKKSDHLSIFSGSGTLMVSAKKLRKWFVNETIIGTDRYCNLSATDDDIPVIAYTGIDFSLPNWHQPYKRGSETQNLAYSLDRGMNIWCKVEKPILALPPKRLNVTGWRDPFIFQDPIIDDLLSVSEKFYMLLGSGLRGFGGSVLMYQSENLVDWKPMTTPLLTVDNLTMFHEAGRLDFSNFTLGFNWEVPNILNMKSFMSRDIPLNTVPEFDKNKPLYLLFFGTEGNARHLRGHHMGVYLLGHLSRCAKEGCVKFDIVSTGRFDHGLLYAVNSVTDFRSGEANERYVFGWINEDWSTDDMEREEFAGAMGLMRSIRVEWAKESSGLYRPILYTEPIDKYNEVKKNMKYLEYSNKTLIRTRHMHNDDDDDIPPPLIPPDHSGSGSNDTKINIKYFPLNFVPTDKRMFISVEVNLDKLVDDFTISNDSLLGLVIHHSAPYSRSCPSADPWKEYTVIYVRPGDLTLHVSRWKSSLLHSANNDTYSMPLRLHSFSNRSSLSFDVSIDHSVLEVFSEGASIASRIYPTSWNNSSYSCFGTHLGLFVGQSTNRTHWDIRFNHVRVWYDSSEPHEGESEFKTIETFYSSVLEFISIVLLCLSAAVLMSKRLSKE